MHSEQQPLAQRAQTVHPHVTRTSLGGATTAPGDTFAIKVMTKTELAQKNMVESVTNEKNILALVSASA